MIRLRQSELACEFAVIVFPGNMHAKLSEADFKQMITIWNGIKKAVDKDKTIPKYTPPKVTNEAKKYIKKYSKSVSFQLMNLRNKMQANTIVPAKTEKEKGLLNMHIAQIDRFVHYYSNAEDEKTKAFIKLVLDIKTIIENA